MDDAVLQQPAGRRARALVRDEFRLRRALADHEARRFDLDTLATVRSGTDDLLETLTAIARDDAFWDGLGRGEVLDEDWRAVLARVDPTAFETLLHASGYHNPPPPPAGELVDDTMRELADALRLNRSEPDRRAAIGRARRGLLLTIMRIRRQIVRTEPSPVEPAVLRSIARSTLTVARWVIPAAVAVTAGVLVEFAAPTTGIGFVVALAAKKVIEDRVQRGTERLLQRLEAPADDEQPPPPEKEEEMPPLPIVVANHVAAAATLLSGVATQVGSAAHKPGFTLPDEHRTALLAAHRHLARADELCADHGLELTAQTRTQVAVIRPTLAQVLDALPVYGTGGPLEVLGESAQALLAAQAELVGSTSSVFGRRAAGAR
jgi:hypothetical protein